MERPQAGLPDLETFRVESVRKRKLTVCVKKDADPSRVGAVFLMCLDPWAVPTAINFHAFSVNIDFMFKLTSGEKAEVVANCDHLTKLKFSPTLPFVFTEHGAIMAANVLNSKRAVQASVQVVRAFIKLRQMLTSNTELARKLSDLERKYDAQFNVVFDAIRQLMLPPEPPRKQIGFTKERKK